MNEASIDKSSVRIRSIQFLHDISLVSRDFDHFDLSAIYNFLPAWNPFIVILAIGYIFEAPEGLFEFFPRNNNYAAHEIQLLFDGNKNARKRIILSRVYHNLIHYCCIQKLWLL